MLNVEIGKAAKTQPKIFEICLNIVGTEHCSVLTVIRNLKLIDFNNIALSRRNCYLSVYYEFLFTGYYGSYGYYKFVIAIINI